MKHLLITLILLVSISSYGQREIVMSQYMYNRYSINPGFGGSHDVMSIFGSYRKQWMGFEGAPTTALFTVNTPLKNEKIALGAQIFNESYAIAANTGFNFSYTYRLPLNNGSKVGIAVSAGYVNYKTNWNDVDIVEQQDNSFAMTENSGSPILGFGAAMYNSKYFVGFSVPTFLYHDRYITGDNSVDFTKIDYLLTAGYMYEISDNISIQPSALLRVNMDDETFVDC